MGKKKQADKLNSQKKNAIISLIWIMAVFLAVIFATVAWFYHQRSVATVTQMGKPSDLAIIGENQTELELDMSPSDPDAATNEDGSVTIKRIFGVKSKNNHWLEIAHTTNIAGFDFKIYRATQNDDGTLSVDNTSITGQYLNETLTDSGTASTEEPYYGKNYLSTDQVQMNAIPLYWMSCQLPVDSNGITYYCLEVTWANVTKETDVFYIFASDSIGDSAT